MHLEALEQLKVIDLERTTITDRTLESLHHWKNLEWLCLNGTHITDEGLQNLKFVSKLKGLTLGFNSSITDKGLENLKDLHELKILDLTRLKITDEGLKHLGGLTSLETLLLWDGPWPLGRSRPQRRRTETRWCVQFLSLAETKVTKAGVAELQKSLPRAAIFHSIENESP